MQIRQADEHTIIQAAELAVRLWSGHTAEEMCAEFRNLCHLPHARIFIAYEDDKAVGFAQSQLRHDYVEGCSQSPVGYLEGIYVDPRYRKCGIAQALLQACEGWAKEMGCAEFASDCELTNTESIAFHTQVGFTEANRIVCFIKPLS